MRSSLPSPGFPRSLTALAAGLLLSGGIGAQTVSADDAGAVEAAAQRVLPTVDVEADRLGTTTEFTGSYTTGASTIGKTPRTLKETPQSVTVMTRTLLDDQNIRSLDDALRATPGVMVQNSSSYERTYHSRGFEIETIQYDGVPTQRRNGFAVSPDLSFYDRVEVLRGPAGLFNGAGQPGGTVNLVRKRPLATPQSSAQLMVSRWDAYRADVDLSRPLNDSGSVRGRLVAGHENRHFFYDRAQTKRSLLYGIVEADLGRDTVLAVGAHYEKNDMVPMYAALPRYTDGRDLGLPRSTNLNAAWAHTDVESTSVFANLAHSFSSDWKLKLGVTHMRENNDDYTGSNFGPVSPATGQGITLSAFHQKLDGKQTAADASLQGSFSALGRRHDVLVGANYLRRDYDLYSQLYTVPNAAINPFTYDPSAYAAFPTVPSPSRAASNTLNRIEQKGLYGSLRWSLTDPLKLIVGGRISSWESSARNKATGAYSTAPYKETSEFTPYAALTYDLNPVWSVYASYAEIFRSQANLFTVDGERLKPVTGSNYEVGIKGSPYGGKLNTSLALFRTYESHRSQVAVPSPCAGSPTGGACYVDEGKLRSQGLDAEVSGELLPRWQIAAGYTYNQTRYLKDTAANTGLPFASFTPRHLVRLWTGYQLPGELSAWTVGGGVTLQSNAYKIDRGVRIDQGGYAVWSARLAYRVTRNVTAAVNITNLFDKTYYQTLGGTRSANWYGEPRTVTATLQAVF